MKNVLLLMIGFLSLTACWSKDQLVVLEGQTMGTLYSVKYVPSIDVDKNELHKEIEGILKEINRQMSTYIPGSEISKFNKHYSAAGMQISPWFAQVLGFALEIAQQSNGAFDPTVGPLVNLWGFGPRQNPDVETSLDTVAVDAEGLRRVPEEAQIKEVLNYVGFKKIQLRPQAETQKKWMLTKQDERVQLDLSAVAKGFAVDKVSEHLSLKGLVHHLVDIGGEIKVRGQKSTSEPWVLAIERPHKDMRAQVRFSITDYAIATSGTYRNFFEQAGQVYSHTIDPHVGRPIENRLLSVSVLQPSCMKADGFATVIMALGLTEGLAFAEKHHIPAYFIYRVPSPSKKKSSGIPVPLKTKSTSAFKSLVGRSLVQDKPQMKSEEK